LPPQRTTAGVRQDKSGADAAAPAPFTPKRGRPTADQASAIARTILAAATELFLAQGYEATTMEAVAAAAGVPKPTLYKRHPDKMSLLRAVMAERLAVWSQIQSARNANLPRDLAGRLKYHAKEVLVWSGSEEVRAFSRLAAGAWGGAAEITEILRVSGYDAMIDKLEAEIRQAAPADGVAVRRPRVVASALMALLSGWLATRPAGDRLTEDEAMAFADTAVDLLMHGKAAW
jgi:AcrR family transcriptional regulator